MKTIIVPSINTVGCFTTNFMIAPAPKLSNRFQPLFKKALSPKRVQSYNPKLQGSPEPNE